MYKQTYSPLIVGSPVVLFLGAGASRPFGKMLMGEFIGYLANEKNFTSRPLFHAITRPPAGTDLEHLFEELDEWSRKAYYDSQDPLNDLEVPALAEQAKSLLGDLRREVFNAYCEIELNNKPVLVKAFDQLFTLVLENTDLAANPIPIFTTNYDPAAETFCQAKSDEYVLHDGFVSQAGSNAATPVWHRESIDKLDMSADHRKHIVLFKLHGSTSWYKRGNEFVKSEIAIHMGTNQRYENLLIYPAKRKVALDDPYFTAYDYFQRTLEGWNQQKKLCIFIGYSFRDYDALSRLRSATCQNPNLKLLVVDPKAKQLCKDVLEPLEIQAESANAHFPEPDSKTLPSSPRQDDYLKKIRASLASLP